MLKSVFKYRFSQQSITLPTHLYPFQFTLSPQQFKFRDSRFEEYPVTQKLYPAEHQHIKFVLQLFQQFLNKGAISKQTKQFVNPRLLSIAQQYKQQLKEEKIKVQFKFDFDSCDESKGYSEFYGTKPNLFLHQYIVNKKDEKVMLVQKQQLRQAAKKSADEQLKQDLQQIKKQNSIGEKIKEKMFKDKGKKSDLVFKIVDFFDQSYKKSKRKKQFESYILVNRIDGKMNLRIQKQQKNMNKSEQVQNILLSTKWLYSINKDEPEAIRKSRKRQLFDFQLWMRGSFIPIKNFAQL